MITLNLKQEEALLKYIYSHGWIGTELEKEITEIKNMLERDVKDD